MENSSQVSEFAETPQQENQDEPTGFTRFQHAGKPASRQSPHAQGPNLMRFKRAVRTILLMCRVCRYFMAHSNFRYIMEFSFFDSLTNRPSIGTGKNLVFDLNHFKVKEDRIPVRLVEIMRKPPEHRTVAEVSLLHNMLSELEFYRRYSVTLQLLLARVVRYQRLERSRVVIRIGHLGQSFYFIFTGLLAITKDKDGTSAFLTKEPILIRKGMSFGDVALIKGLRRNATVVCMEETELMVIDKEDFFANKMDVELKREFDYRFSYFRSVEVVSSWSSSLIEMMADHSKTQQIRYGRVIVKDTNDLGDIIFIGKGQCDVLRMVDLKSCRTYRQLLKQHQQTMRENQAKCNRRPGHPKDVQTQQCLSDNTVMTNFPSPSRGLPADVPKVACFLVDNLCQGSTFGLNQYLMPQKQRDCRRFVLVSRSVEILRMEKTRFDEHVDDTTLKKLEALQKTYPSDEELCTFFMERGHWKDFKNGVMQDLLPHQVEPKASKPQQADAGPSRFHQQKKHTNS
ncbi:cyclic nucleotide-binding domain-containing protein 2-like [Hypomesus transpacificus]|uniref:cyclic nucleotide-binding domain-containing protein 2-like n=1 Tax=Hypomesus transpacificus TaxID=137520 RepID=UPI001F077438|nr:cyclic nucleotide-binding domain-containing protein 2-like [Hypomesus transpacificus]